MSWKIYSLCRKSKLSCERIHGFVPPAVSSLISKKNEKWRRAENSDTNVWNCSLGLYTCVDEFAWCVCVCVWVGCGPRREVHKVRIWKFLLSGQNSQIDENSQKLKLKKKKFSSRFCSDFFGPITKMLVTCWHYIRWYHTTDWCVSHGVSPGASHMSRVSTCCSVCTDLLRCHS